MSEQAEQIVVVYVCKCPGGSPWGHSWDPKYHVDGDPPCGKCNQPIRAVNITALERAAHSRPPVPPEIRELVERVSSRDCDCYRYPEGDKCLRCAAAALQAIEAKAQNDEGE